VGDSDRDKNMVEDSNRQEKGQGGGQRDKERDKV